ncbi:MAG: hypothetical protein EOP47_18930 [Sphingobacteriaceae bacterium]|nr:MAG: hypothetical protein EOP47_18930 [Sphingobacteriaceae bacterium]
MGWFSHSHSSDNLLNAYDAGRYLQQSYYGDQDGKESYANFMTMFTGSDWKVNRSAEWVEIKSTKGKPVFIYANLPLDYEKGLEIHGLNEAEATDSIVFHSGTKAKDDKILTNGGRVLAVTSFGNDIKTAVEISKETLMNVYFEGVNYRHDIGYEFPS